VIDVIHRAAVIFCRFEMVRSGSAINDKLIEQLARPSSLFFGVGGVPSDG
jgi:hypothetical protein